MVAPYPYNIDGSTVAGQIEVLRLWSQAQLNESSACVILKVTTAELRTLANAHSIEPPSQQALDKRILELEAIFRPRLRSAKRDQMAEGLASAEQALIDLLDRVASIATEADVYGQGDARALYSVVHARLRRALDGIMSAKDSFAEARTIEDQGPTEFTYGDASLSVLRNLDPIVPRPDYYLVGDFEHVNPVTEHDILWCWSKGFLTTEVAAEMLELEEGDTIAEVCAQFDIPRPAEEALSPIEAAMILGDDPNASDPTLNVRRRIRDGRLESYFRSDVEKRRAFENRLRDMRT